MNEEIGTMRFRQEESRIARKRGKGGAKSNTPSINRQIDCGIKTGPEFS